MAPAGGDGGGGEQPAVYDGADGGNVACGSGVDFEKGASGADDGGAVPPSDGRPDRIDAQRSAEACLWRVGEDPVDRVSSGSPEDSGFSAGDGAGVAKLREVECPE